MSSQGITWFWEVTPLLHHLGTAVQAHEGSLAVMPQPFCKDDVVPV